MSQCNPRVLVSRARTLKSKENIKIFARVRPPTESEVRKSEDNAVERATPEKDCISDVQGKPDPYTLTFDHVFDEHSSQSDVFEIVGIPTVDNVLTGYNSTIFVHGHMGAGRTHTMVGNINNYEQRGLGPRALDLLYKRIKEEEATQNPPPNYEVVCSHLEIYKETITDLLNPNSTNLQIRNDSKFDSRINVEGLKGVEVKCFDDAIKLLKEGVKNGQMSTNSESMSFTKSIKIYSYFITRKEQSEEDGPENARASRLILVDLAGCKRIKGTDMMDAETIRERCFLNRTYTALGRVLDCLAEKNSKQIMHIPYRDSKLTSLLKESFRDNAKTTIVVEVSSTCSSSGDFLSTHQFLQHAKHIKNKAKVNEVLKQDPVASQMEVMKPGDQIERVNEGGSIRDSNDTSSAPCTPDLNFELEHNISENAEKIEEPEAQLEEAQFENNRAADQNRRMESENQYLTNLETQLQTNDHNTTTESAVLQERLDEAEEITNKVLEAERSVYEEMLEHEKQECDAKITKLEEDSMDHVAQSSQLSTINNELRGTLDITNAALNSNTNEMEDFSNEHLNEESALKDSEAKCMDLESKLVEANGQIKEQRSQLAALQSELERTIAKSDEFETDNARLKETIESLKQSRSEFERTLQETEMLVHKLKREKTELGVVVEMIQKRREDLQTEVERYGTLSKTQKGDAAPLTTKFDRTYLELQEEIIEKEKELQRAKESFNAQSAARDAKIAEVVRRFEEMIATHQDDFRSCIINGSEEDENDTKELERIDTNSKDEARLVILDRTSFERDQQMMNPMGNIRLILQRIKTKESEVTEKRHADLKAFYHDPEDKVSNFQSETAQRQSTCTNEDVQNKHVSENQVLQLEALMSQCEQLASNKQTIIAFYVNQIQEIEQEVDKYFLEVDCGETEDRAVFNDDKHIIRSLQRQLKRRDSKIAALKAQLNAEEEESGSFYFEDNTCITNMCSDHDCPYSRLLKRMGHMLKKIGILVPGSNVIVLPNFDEDMA